MLRRRRNGLMAGGMWLEGTLADCPGEPLTENQISWKNALPDALREVCNRVATAGGGSGWSVALFVKPCLRTLERSRSHDNHDS